MNTDQRLRALPVFGDHIRRLRKQAALIIPEAADKLGCDYIYLSKLENGREVSPPKEWLIRRLALLYEVDAAALLAMAAKEAA